MFVIVITVAIGFGLRLTKEATQEVKSEAFLYQSSIILEDILKILQNSPDLARVGDANSSTELFMLLSSASFIPFESQGISVVMKLSSARSKFPLSALTLEAPQRIEALKEYVSGRNVNAVYVDILLDANGKIKEDRSYNSAIFEENPSLFRDYIASKGHLEAVNDFYAKTYNDNSLKNIAFENLFSYAQEANATIDLNFATAEVWELLLGAPKERALFLVQNAGAYTDLESLALSEEEQSRLERFETSFFEPKLLVTLEIAEGKSMAIITFEYDIQKKKGSHFDYEI